jgi:Core-2/I-Branching enzyme
MKNGPAYNEDRQSMSDAQSKLTGDAPPQFAYLVLAHKNPSQLMLLAKVLAGQSARVYIHIDGKIDVEPFIASLGPLPRVTILSERYEIYWGGYNMIRATLAMCRHALADGADRLVLLSGLDFPIKPMREVESVLAAPIDFIDMIQLPAPGLGDGDGFYRIQYYYGMDLMARLGLKPRLLFTLHRRLLPWWRRRPPVGLDVRMGSQWWSLQSKTVRKVIESLDTNPEIEDFFKWTSIPDESLFHTLVHTYCSEHVVPQTHRLIVWDRAPKPYVFKAQDWAELMRSDALFARKFDACMDGNILARLVELAESGHGSGVAQ